MSTLEQMTELCVFRTEPLCRLPVSLRPCHVFGMWKGLATLEATAPEKVNWTLHHQGSLHCPASPDHIKVTKTRVFL